MSLPTPKKKNVPSIKGMKYDPYFKMFEKPGDTLEFDEADISRQQASQIAARMTVLSGGKQFHSFYSSEDKKTNVRWRVDGELEEKQEEEPKDSPAESVTEVRYADKARPEEHPDETPTESEDEDDSDDSNPFAAASDDENKKEEDPFGLS